MTKRRRNKNKPIPKTAQQYNKHPINRNLSTYHGPMSGLYPFFSNSVDYTDHFNRSVIKGQRVEIDQLRRLANIPPVRKAIRRIGNGVINMPWVINAPKDKLQDENALKTVERIKYSLLRPVERGRHNIYSKLVRSLIQEILVVGCAAVERYHIEKDSERAFYLWDADVKHLHFDLAWNDDSNPKDPRYWAYRPETKEYVEVLDEDLFLITYDCNSHQLVPPGPMEIAYQAISGWLGLSEFQNNTTSNAIREKLLVIKGITDEELTAFRQYWKGSVVMQGEIPSISSPDPNFEVNVVAVGSKGDEELYLKFTEYLLKIIAICFDLSMRDLNYSDHDNRATAGFAADSTFADAVLPMASLIQESFWLEVVDRYYPGFKFEFVDTEPRSQSDEASTANTLFSGSLITKNEARIRVGHDPLQNGGDIFNDGTTLEDLADSDSGNNSSSRQSTEKSTTSWW
jgi:hypothetical protein